MHLIFVFTVMRPEQHQNKSLYLGLKHFSTRHLPDKSTATARPVPASLSKLCCSIFTACHPSTCIAAKSFNEMGLKKTKPLRQ